MKLRRNTINFQNNKIRFLLIGTFNLIISNIIFQILLYKDIFPVIFSSLIYVAFYAIFGFILYGKLLFKKKIIFKLSLITKYLILLIFSWFILNLAIYIGLKVNISANIVSLIVIPLVAINSYLVQKVWVFK